MIDTVRGIDDLAFAMNVLTWGGAFRVIGGRVGIQSNGHAIMSRDPYVRRPWATL